MRERRVSERESRIKRKIIKNRKAKTKRKRKRIQGAAAAAVRR